jgi:hypothetical protein
VASESGQERTYSGPVGLTSLDPAAAEGDGDTVETVALDDYVTSNPPPDVLKVDVEGFEYDVLHGGASLLATSPPETIVLEVHPPEIRAFGHDPSDVISLLADHGYDCRPLRTRDENAAARADLESTIDDHRNVTLLCRRDG